MSKRKRKSLFIGRWSPYHNGHEAIIRKALDAGKSVAIAVRDTPQSDNDPFSYNERLEMLKAQFGEDDVEVLRIPDIESVNIGCKVGYDVNKYDVPEEVASISATEIRRKLREGDPSWEKDVPPTVATYLKSFNAVKRLRDGCVIWLTGLPCSGKSTLAKYLRSALADIEEVRYRNIKILDGDELRKGLCSDLSFSPEDRDENIRRVAYLAAMLADARSIVIAAFVSPYRVARERARGIVGADRFFEAYVDCSVDECRRRDVKGMYMKADAGEIDGFTGVDAPYEIPENPFYTIYTDRFNGMPKHCADGLVDKLCHGRR